MQLLTFINARMIPGKIEEENLELKEKITILKCCLERYAKEEYINESDDLVKLSDEEEMDLANTECFHCEICFLEVIGRKD